MIVYGLLGWAGQRLSRWEESRSIELCEQDASQSFELATMSVKG